MKDEQMKSLLQKNQPLPKELSEAQKQIMLESTLQRLNLKKSSSIWLGLPAVALSLILAYNIMTTNVAPQQDLPVADTEIVAFNNTPGALDDSDDDIALEIPSLEVGEEFLTLADSNQMQ